MKKGQKLIEIWYCHNPISLSDMVINIQDKIFELPKDVQKRVDENWEKFKKTKSDARNDDIAYLITETHSKDFNVFLDGYKYNQYFNRDDKEMKDTKVANDFNYNPFSSWIMAVCDDSALFGNKKDFGDKKVSGFGGFTNQEDVVDGIIDANHWIQRKLKEEMKDMSSAIQRVSMIGLNYYPIVGPKGFDSIYVARLDGTAEQLQKHFSEGTQFAKQLIQVKTDPKSLVAFLEDNEPTRSCIGGIFTYIGSRYGPDEFIAILKTYSQGDIIRFQ